MPLLNRYMLSILLIIVLYENAIISTASLTEKDTNGKGFMQSRQYSNEVEDAARSHRRKRETHFFSYLTDDSTSNESDISIEEWSSWKIYTGTFIALLSSVFCGLSFTIKKYGIRQVERQGGKMSDMSYLKNKFWLLGQLFIITGDLSHYLALYFAPSIVICTVQILSVLVTAVSSYKCLGEKVHKFSKQAFALQLSSCLVIVTYAPDEKTVTSASLLLSMMADTVFLTYMTVLMMFTALLIFYVVPKWGHLSSIPQTVLSAILGALMVIAIKGASVKFEEYLTHWLPWFSLAALVLLLAMQISYFNSALRMYDTLVVATQFYVSYMTFVIITSSLLFKVWRKASMERILINFCTFWNIILGFLLFNLFDEDATFDFSKLFGHSESAKIH